MIDISSHLKRSEFKMRVLIVSAFLAYAAAAPSGLITPYFYQPLVFPAAVPTVSAGDIQAAAIDAQVQINDLARAAADQARAAADQAKLIADVASNSGDDQAAAIDAQVKINDAQVLANDAQIQANDAQILANSPQVKSNDAPAEANDGDDQANDAEVQAADAKVQADDQARAAADNAQIAAEQAQIANEKALAAVDQINEKNVEAFWSNEERKWEVIDAVKSAEARIDGSAAGNAELNAKVAIGSVVPYYSPIAPVARVAPLWQYNGVPAVGPVVGQPIVRYAPFPAVNGPFATTYVQNVW